MRTSDSKSQHKDRSGLVPMVIAESSYGVSILVDFRTRRGNLLSVLEGGPLLY